MAVAYIYSSVLLFWLKFKLKKKHQICLAIFHLVLNFSCYIFMKIQAFQRLLFCLEQLVNLGFTLHVTHGCNNCEAPSPSQGVARTNILHSIIR